MPKTEIIYSYDQAMKIYDDPKLEVVGEHETGFDNTFVLNYRKKDINDARPGNTSISLASFVTAYARTELENLMYKINHPCPIQAVVEEETGEIIREASDGDEYQRCLYWDTDSAIYVENGTFPTMQTGDYLGELTDEVLGEFKTPNFQIKRAVFLGPKTYAYEVVDINEENEDQRESHAKTTVKCKGVTLHAQALQKLNVDKMIKRALQYQKNQQIKPIRVRQATIRAHAGTQLLYTYKHTKDTSLTIGKRALRNDGYMYPIGFYVDRDLYPDSTFFMDGSSSGEFSTTSESEGDELFETVN